VIVALCGPPGAGKTTVTARVRDRLEAHSIPVRTVHSDDFSSRTYEQVAERVADAPAAGVTLVDGTFYRRAWQTRIRALGEARFVRLTASLETCLERNRTRTDSIDERGVHVVYREFDAPVAALSIDTDRCGPDAAADRIATAVEGWLE